FRQCTNREVAPPGFRVLPRRTAQQVFPFFTAHPVRQECLHQLPELALTRRVLFRLLHSHLRYSVPKYVRPCDLFHGRENHVQLLETLGYEPLMIGDVPGVRYRHPAVAALDGYIPDW